MNDRESNACRRCGVCCEKGGPGLHRADRALVEAGHLPGRYLFTLRRGELARDNVADALAPLQAEIIKIKGRRPAWTCRFYDAARRGCEIYTHRPLECRVLDCRDTRRIEAVYDVDRLTRRDLLSGIPGLWDLIEDHERRCAYAELTRLAGEGERDGCLRQSEAILEILGFDAHVRRLAVEKGKLDADMLEFIFGRRLTETIGMYGIRPVRRNGACVLAFGPTGPNASIFPEADSPVCRRR